jgi:hypothetical protein
MQNVLPRSRSAILILSAGIALFILIPGQSSQPDGPIPLREPTAPAVSAGSTAYLSNDGGAIGVGADVETLAALAQAVVAKDRQAYEHLFQDGRAFLVSDRVRVLVISLQGDSAKVQFLEGYHSGKSGFVIREWLKFTP